MVHLPFLSLYFPSSPTQHLELIRISGISPADSQHPGSRSCNLTYDSGRQVLLSKSQSLTRGVIGRLLGPTYAAQGAVLEYPGVHFTLSPAVAGSSGREDSVQSIDVKPKADSGPESSRWRGVTAIRILVSRSCAEW